MDNPTMLAATLTVAENEVRIRPLAGGNMELSWDGPGQLEASNNVEAGYTSVAGGSVSPVIVNPSAQKKFYRFRR